MVEKIGIRFTDNDFTTTIHAFLSTVGNEWRRGYSGVTKEEFLNLYNQTISAFYCVAQRPDWQPEEKRFEMLSSDYLHVKLTDIYFNEEVDKFLEDEPRGYNGEFFYIDCSITGFNYETNETFSVWSW